MAVETWLGSFLPACLPRPKPYLGFALRERAEAALLNQNNALRDSTIMTCTLFLGSNNMIVRSLNDVEATDHFVDWGNGTSHRLLTAKDGMGFSLCHTVVRANTVSFLQYRNHLEACYCIAGEGEVEDMEGNVFALRKGDMYVLDKHDKHLLRGGPDKDMILVSIFNPPLNGTECHNLNDPTGSAY